MDYARWIEHIFGTSAAAKNNPNAAILALSLGPTEVVQLVTRIFTNCGSDLARFTDVQVADGLTFIGAAGESDWMYSIYDRRVPWAERVTCIRSIIRLYSDCFARRCSNSTSYLRPPGALNSTCFMWWDRFPSGGLSDTTVEERDAVDRELIGVMATALQLPHNACRESALHGLGHWATADPQRVHPIVDGWLAGNRDLPKALIEYARAPRIGQVQ